LSEQTSSPPKTKARSAPPGLASRAVATTILTRVIDDGRGLDGLLDTRHGPPALKNLSDMDKALVRAIATAALRHRGHLLLVFNRLMNRPPPKNARHLHHTLHVAAAQILFMDVPDSAAVNLAVTAIGNEKRSARFTKLANAVLRRMSREKKELLALMQSDEMSRAAMAPWLHKRVKKAYGLNRATKIATQHMLEPVVDITVRDNPALWAKRLTGITLFGNTVRVARKGKVETWPGYEEGAWWVQDAAASLPAHLLGDVAQLQVADLCAAPGGKTAQLAAKGAHVTAVETSASRLDRLKQNFGRLNLTANFINADLFDWQPQHLFDAVLLDAPCSSTGTVRRHPDVQWIKSPQIVSELANLQERMILHAARFVKPGGCLVFANCSIDRTEGEDIYARIIKGKHGLDPSPVMATELFGRDEMITGQGTVRTLPCHLQDMKPPPQSTIEPERYSGLDGFFAARFIKTS